MLESYNIIWWGVWIAMKRRDILRHAATGTGIALASTTASASGNGPNQLETEFLSGKEEKTVLRDAWQDVRELRTDIQRQYGFSFSRNDGGAKRITSTASGNELTMAAFESGFDSLGNDPDDSRHALIMWTAENGEANDPHVVIEGMASDFDDVPTQSLDDQEYKEALNQFDASEEQILSSYVSVIRIHREDTQKTFLNVHSNSHEYGLLAEQAANAAEAQVSVDTEAGSSDVIYSSQVRATSDGISTAGHGGGGLMDCVKDAPLGATAIACIGSCVNAGTIVGAAACAACGCYAGCWAGSCSQHVGNEFCTVTDFSCGLSIVYPPTAGTCCVAFGCHFDCAWLD